ncbi:MAG: hypothetical protein EOP43_05710 [Sphingobacteriaceae bacterium]|nr:MAG: hypothetical protein EOP43_05710 [Sphingobacteriaceae bacterium]
MYKFIFFICLTLGFLSCKRSMQHQTNREYDAKLVRALQKLERKYANKKVRINTWDKQTDAYQDIQTLDENDKLAEILTIGDSVQFVTIDLSQSDGIRAEIKLKNNHTGYIPYFKIEEFEPAIKFDPDLKE